MLPLRSFSTFGMAMRRASCGDDYLGVPYSKSLHETTYEITWLHHTSAKTQKGGFTWIAVLAFAHIGLCRSLTRSSLCRCQSNGPFRLDPEEVESGLYMSPQVQTSN